MKKLLLFVIPLLAATYPVSPASGAAGAATATTNAAAAATQLLQHGRQWLSQSRYPEAVQCLEHILNTPSDPAVASEARRCLTQAYASWLTAFESGRLRIEASIKQVEQQVEQAQKELDADNQSLEEKRSAENQVIVLPSGYWFNGRYIHHTRRGTGDPQAPSVIRSLELKTLTGANEVKRLRGEITKLQQQLTSTDYNISALKNKIAAVPQTPLPQAPQPPPPTPQPQLKAQIAALSAAVQSDSMGSRDVKIIEAKYGAADVTAFVQNFVKEGSAVQALPSLYALSEESTAGQKLTIRYTLRDEEKTISIESGWAVTIPDLKLTPPANTRPAAAPERIASTASPGRALQQLAPEPPTQADAPWYEKNLKWILGGLVGLWVVGHLFKRRF